MASQSKLLYQFERFSPINRGKSHIKLIKSFYQQKYFIKYQIISQFPYSSQIVRKTNPHDKNQSNLK